MDKPSDKNVTKMQKYAEKFAEKSGSYLHPDRSVTETVVEGLARHIEEVGFRCALAISIRTSRPRPSCAGGGVPATRCRCTSTATACCLLMKKVCQLQNTCRMTTKADRYTGL